jgi:hypothetical protein
MLFFTISSSLSYFPVNMRLAQGVPVIDVHSPYLACRFTRVRRREDLRLAHEYKTKVLEQEETKERQAPH